MGSGGILLIVFQRLKKTLLGLAIVLHIGIHDTHLILNPVVFGVELQHLGKTFQSLFIQSIFGVVVGILGILINFRARVQ